MAVLALQLLLLGASDDTTVTVILAAVSSVATVAAALAALVALIYARKSLGAAKEAVELSQKSVVAAKATVELSEQSVAAAKATIELAERARRDAELDRKRDRLEHVGQVVERVYWMAKGGYTVDTAWLQEGNVLKQALVGLEDELPECASIPGLLSAGMAKAAASRERDEVRIKLEVLSRTPDEPPA